MFQGKISARRVREGFCPFLNFFLSEATMREGWTIFRIFFLLSERCVKGGFFGWEGKGEWETLNFSVFEIQREEVKEESMKCPPINNTLLKLKPADKKFAIFIAKIALFRAQQILIT